MRMGTAALGALLLALLLMPSACGSSVGAGAAGSAGSPLEAGTDSQDEPVSSDDVAGSDTPDEAADSDVPEGPSTPWACRSWDDCADNTICDFALGRCERRDTAIAAQLGLYDFKPPAGTAGDVMVVDGCRFFQGFPAPVKVTIGSSTIPAVADENRALITLTSDESGTVGVIGKGGATASGGEFTQSGQGILDCDDTTASATGVPGSSVFDSGPYAAAYVDDAQRRNRVYYPSTCGSVRRPPVGGTHPLVSLLHGNGAIYLNYEYLAQFLATWGFVSIMPDEAEESGNTALRAIVESYVGVDLGAHIPILSGVSTTPQIAHIGHSRGAGRMQDITANGLLSAATVASVFLGPVDNGTTVPGLFMTISATKDGQSPTSFSNDAYSHQSAPKWHVSIHGGNHSLFADEKVWTAPLDGAAEITRTQQFRIVAAFVLPLLERAFDMTEHFPDQIAHPPASGDYAVQMEE